MGLDNTLLIPVFLHGLNIDHFLVFGGGLSSLCTQGGAKFSRFLYMLNGWPLTTIQSTILSFNTTVKHLIVTHRMTIVFAVRSGQNIFNNDEYMYIVQYWIYIATRKSTEKSLYKSVVKFWTTIRSNAFWSAVQIETADASNNEHHNHNVLLQQSCGMVSCVKAPTMYEAQDEYGNNVLL